MNPDPSLDFDVIPEYATTHSPFIRPLHLEAKFGEKLDNQILSFRGESLPTIERQPFTAVRHTDTLPDNKLSPFRPRQTDEELGKLWRQHLTQHHRQTNGNSWKSRKINGHQVQTQHPDALPRRSWRTPYKYQNESSLHLDNLISFPPDFEIETSSNHREFSSSSRNKTRQFSSVPEEDIQLHASACNAPPMREKEIVPYSTFFANANGGSVLDIIKQEPLDIVLSNSTISGAELSRKKQTSDKTMSIYSQLPGSPSADIKDRYESPNDVAFTNEPTTPQRPSQTHSFPPSVIIPDSPSKLTEKTRLYNSHKNGSKFHQFDLTQSIVCQLTVEQGPRMGETCGIHFPTKHLFFAHLRGKKNHDHHYSGGKMNDNGNPGPDFTPAPDAKSIDWGYCTWNKECTKFKGTEARKNPLRAGSLVRHILEYHAGFPRGILIRQVQRTCPDYVYLDK